MLLLRDCNWQLEVQLSVFMLFLTDLIRVFVLTFDNAARTSGLTLASLSEFTKYIPKFIFITPPSTHYPTPEF